MRFTNTFFTVIAPPEPSPGEPGRFGGSQGSEIVLAALMQEIQGLINPVPPEGDALIRNVKDLQTQTRLKVMRARTAVADTFDLLAEDLLTAFREVLQSNPAGRFYPDNNREPEESGRRHVLQ